MNKIYSFLRDALLVSLVIIAFIFLPHVILHMGEYVKPELLFLYVPNIRIDAVLIVASVGILALVLLSVHYRFRYRIWLLLVPLLLSFWAVFYDDNRHWNLIYNLVVYSFLCTAFIAFALFCREQQLPLPDILEKYEIRFGRLTAYKAGLERITRLAQNANAGISIALFGAWGSGKTHFLRYVQRELKAKNDSTSQSKEKQNLKSTYYTVKQINLWQCHDIEEAWNNIIEELYEAIREENGSPIISLGRRVLALLSKAEISVLGISGALDSIVNNRSNDGIRHAVHKLSSCISYPEKVAILIIDDVERADISIIEALLPLLERLRKIKGLIVICAIAREELEEKFKEAGKSSLLIQGYIDKLFDQSIYLPPIPDFYSSIEFKKRVDETAPDCKRLTVFAQKYIMAFDTPRQMMRVVERLSAIEKDYFMIPDAKNINIDSVFLIEILRLLYPTFLNDPQFIQLVKKCHYVCSQRIKNDNLSDGGAENSGSQINMKKERSKIFDTLIADYKIGGKLLPSLCSIIEDLAASECDDLLKAYFMSYSKNVKLTDEVLRQIVNSVANSKIYATLDNYLLSYCENEASIENPDDAKERMLKIILSRVNENETYAELLKQVIDLEIAKGTEEARNKLIFRKEFILDFIAYRLCVNGKLVKRFYFAILGRLASEMKSWKELYAAAEDLLLYQHKKAPLLTGRWNKLDEHYSDKMPSLRLNAVFYPILARRIIKEYEVANRTSLNRESYVQELRFFERYADLLPESTYLNAYAKAHQGNLGEIVKNYFKFLLKDNCRLYKNTIRLVDEMFLSARAEAKWRDLSTEKRRKLLGEIADLSLEISASAVGDYVVVGKKLHEIQRVISVSGRNYSARRRGRTGGV